LFLPGDCARVAGRFLSRHEGGRAVGRPLVRDTARIERIVSLDAKERLGAGRSAETDRKLVIRLRTRRVSREQRLTQRRLHSLIRAARIRERTARSDRTDRIERAFTKGSAVAVD